MNVALQSNIYKAQDVMLAMPQAETEVTHHFADGIYARELFIPAGVCLVGALHNTNHLFTVSQGECVAVTHESREEIKAPYMGQTQPGMKRMIYAITDTVWTTFHVTEETDVDKISKEILEESDHESFKREYNITEDLENLILQTVNDLDMSDIDGVKLERSGIDGMGVFAEKFIKGEKIGYARLNDKRTILGRYTNHAKYSNAYPVKEGKNILLISSADINNEEITVNYRDMININEELKVML